MAPRKPDQQKLLPRHNRKLILERSEIAELARRGYRIGDAIATGLESSVYFALHYWKKCAVKQIDMTHAKVADVVTEMFTLKTFRHPYMIAVLDFFCIKTQHLLIFMELAEGGSLRMLLRAYNLREAHVAELYSQFGSALAYLHENGVAHRNLAPENILLNKEKSVAKLADFGLAACCYDPVTGKPKMVDNLNQCSGTLWYMAPELLRILSYYLEEDDDHPELPPPVPFCPFLADIWSLGLVLYEMHYGYLPFKPVIRILSNYDAIIQRVVSDWRPFDVDEEGGRELSLPAECFIKRHLKWRPGDRPDVVVLLKDLWITRRGDVLGYD